MLYEHYNNQSLAQITLQQLVNNTGNEPKISCLAIRVMIHLAEYLEHSIV